MVSDTNSYF